MRLVKITFCSVALAASMSGCGEAVHNSQGGDASFADVHMFTTQIDAARDGSASGEAGPTRDGSAAVDSHEEMDSGAEIDASEALDAGFNIDGGQEFDTGFPEDAGFLEIDAGFAVDAGTADAGTSNDADPPHVCVPGSTRCNENVKEVCAGDGQSYQRSETCELGCMQGECTACERGEWRCEQGVVLSVCREDRKGFEVSAICNARPNVCFNSVGSCSTGTCVYAPTDGIECDDENPCTTKTICRSGQCRGGQSKCDDGEACTIDMCDPSTGQCRYDSQPAGTTCDDHNACTLGDVCSKGVCGGGRCARECIWFADADSDKFGAAGSNRCQSTQPPGFTQMPGDCCDQDPNAFPGTKEFFEKPSRCDSFDYDCSTHTEYETPREFGMCIFSESMCRRNPGWLPTDSRVPPDCGGQGNYLLGCTTIRGDLCLPVAQPRVQRCH